MKLEDTISWLGWRHPGDPFGLPNGSKIYPFAIVEAGAEIGESCKVESFCFVEHGAKLGNRVTLKPGVYVWDGIEIEDDCFIGPGAKFCNDSWPRIGKPCPVEKTWIGHGVSIGAGAIILPGSRIQPHSMVAAGALVGKEPCKESAPRLYVRSPGGVSGMLDRRVNDDYAACERCRKEGD